MYVRYSLLLTAKNSISYACTHGQSQKFYEDLEHSGILTEVAKWALGMQMT